jgi:signal transduction histidine kinase
MTEVSITDAGIGMNEITRDTLFTRPDGHSIPGTNQEKGSGIGLSLVKDFVRQHKGTLRVESEIKKGTCVHFTVPWFA